MTRLREVLRAFEGAQRPMSLGDLSRQLDMERSALEGMLDFWVHKGRLREVNSSHMPNGCAACSGAKGCPFVVNMPRCYELAEASESRVYSLPRCECAGDRVEHRLGALRIKRLRAAPERGPYSI